MPDGVANVGEDGGDLGRQLLVLVSRRDLRTSEPGSVAGARGTFGAGRNIFATKRSEAATARIAMIMVSMALDGGVSGGGGERRSVRDQGFAALHARRGR